MIRKMNRLSSQDFSAVAPPMPDISKDEYRTHMTTERSVMAVACGGGKAIAIDTTRIACSIL